MARLPRTHKYGARRTEWNGRKFDSQLEAYIAARLELRLRLGEIAGLDYQYRVDMVAYDAQGIDVLTKSHKVDFRVHHLDGSYELVEAKGFETADWRERRLWLERLWLPEHPDHRYLVVRSVSDLERNLVPRYPRREQG